MDSNIVLTTITSSAMFVLVIQYLKSAQWFPWLDAGKKAASRYASIIFAFLGHAGANYVWNPNSRQLILTIPTLSAALVYLWHVGNHFALQEITYQATVNKLSTTTKATGPAVPLKVDAAGEVVTPKP